jgi:hypothetical protein
MERRMFWKNVFFTLLRVAIISLVISVSIQILYKVYEIGYKAGFSRGQIDAEQYYSGYLDELAYLRGQIEKEPAIITKEVYITPAPDNKPSLLRDASWGGPDLWEAVNKKRQNNGVNTLSQKDDLCTIASIRLNELLELGTLDGHEGFSNMTERRPDLEGIFKNYSTIAEFLAAGAGSAQETVGLWEKTLGHKKLLTGGEYVWGCIYAQNSFAVAISAF